MPLVLYPDPRLSESAPRRAVDAGLRAIGERLQAAADAAAAYGLAAVHIGAVAPVVVVSIANDVAQRDYRLLFNPEVTGVANALEAGLEGSVSLPGIEVELRRPVWIDVAYEDAVGQGHSLHLEGLPARVALHEIDQMNGIFFLDRLSRLKRDTALRKWKKRRPG